MLYIPAFAESITKITPHIEITAQEKGCCRTRQPFSIKQGKGARKNERSRRSVYKNV
jgi:hypothetical protein